MRSMVSALLELQISRSPASSLIPLPKFSSKPGFLNFSTVLILSHIIPFLTDCPMHCTVFISILGCSSSSGNNGNVSRHSSAPGGKIASIWELRLWTFLKCRCDRHASFSPSDFEWSQPCNGSQTDLLPPFPHTCTLCCSFVHYLAFLNQPKSLHPFLSAVSLILWTFIYSSF